MLPTLRVGYSFIAIAVPGVPFVLLGAVWIILYWALSTSAMVHHLPFVHTRSTLRSGEDFRRAVPHDDLRFGVGIHEDAILAFGDRMNRGVRCGQSRYPPRYLAAGNRW